MANAPGTTPHKTRHRVKQIAPRAIDRHGETHNLSLPKTHGANTTQTHEDATISGKITGFNSHLPFVPDCYPYAPTEFGTSDSQTTPLYGTDQPDSPGLPAAQPRERCDTALTGRLTTPRVDLRRGWNLMSNSGPVVPRCYLRRGTSPRDRPLFTGTLPRTDDGMGFGGSTIPPVMTAIISATSRTPSRFTSA